MLHLLYITQELNKRREEDKQRAKEVAEAEIEHLKATGKVGPKKCVTKSINQRTKNQPKSPREKRSPRGMKSPRAVTSPRDGQPQVPDHVPELQVSRRLMGILYTYFLKHYVTVQ